MKALVSLSGGMDSTTVLGVACQMHPGQVKAIGFTYGSKHNKYENEAALKIADYYKVPFTLIDLRGIFQGNPSHLMQGGGPIPEGHYEDKTMKRTVVPGRNLIFASILASIAESKKISSIWLGVHSGDHAIYPDCRPNFISALESVIGYSTEFRVNVYTPFLNSNKSGILTAGYKINVPYYLTRTCYKAQKVACGKCGSCQERLEAFTAVKIKDPIPYE